eukprot:bmy_15779T0
MFNGGMATTSTEIELPDVEPAAFLALLKTLKQIQWMLGVGVPPTDCSSTEKEAGELCGTPIHLPAPRSTVLPCPETLGVNGLGGLKGYPQQSRQLFRCGAYFFFPPSVYKNGIGSQKERERKKKGGREEKKRKESIRKKME